jgi:hypothetical protein
MYLKRKAERLSEDILASDKIGVILGARQVGKTTLVEHVLAGRQAVFLNFLSLIVLTLPRSVAMPGRYADRLGVSTSGGYRTATSSPARSRTSNSALP